MCTIRKNNGWTGNWRKNKRKSYTNTKKRTRVFRRWCVWEKSVQILCQKVDYKAIELLNTKLFEPLIEEIENDPSFITKGFKLKDCLENMRLFQYKGRVFQVFTKDNVHRFLDLSTPDNAYRVFYIDSIDKATFIRIFNIYEPFPKGDPAR